MKITIKTLDQKTVQFDFEDTKTIWDLKLHLFKQLDIAVQPDHQQLIYAGRILDNDHSIRSYNIDERKFLVVMGKKQQRSPGAKKTPEKKEPKVKTTKPTEQAGPSGQERTTGKKEPPEKHSCPGHCCRSLCSHSRLEVLPRPVNSVFLPTANRKPPVEVNERLVRVIRGMGYPEPEVRRALAASFNNPDRAIEYLVEGIPEVPDPPQQLNEGLVGPQSPLSPLNTSPLHFLRADPRFHQMRRIIQQRPDMLGSVLAKIGESNPPLLSIIRQHQEDFVRMLNESEEDSGSDVTDMAGDAVVEVVLTDGERLAVERLIGLGFPRELVVQAYIACDKNEEQTADFLFQNMDDN